MDKQTVWQRLTDWEKSPVLKFMRDLRIRCGEYLLLYSVLHKKDAIDDLIRIGEHAVPVLIDVLKNEDWMVRQKAIEALAKIENKSAVPYLIEALKDEYANVRFNAVKALGILGDPGAISALIKTLNDKSRDVREMAPVALSKIAENGVDVSTAIPALIDILRNGNIRMQYKGAEALAMIAEKTAEKGDYPTALKIIKDSTEEIRKLPDKHLRRKILGKFAEATQKINDEMNSVDNDKKFPRKRQDVKKHPKARRAILAS